MEAFFVPGSFIGIYPIFMSKDSIQKMGKAHKILLLIPGMLTLVLIELNPRSSVGALKMIRANAKRISVNAIAEFTLDSTHNLSTKTF